MIFSIVKNISIILIATSLLTACGGGSSSGGGGGGGPTDTTAPTAVVAPTAKLLNANTPIVITFDESMDTNIASYSITGDMASESDGGIWSDGIATNDTLTISPMGSNWTNDTARRLIINAQDPAGNPVVTITASYDVYAGTLFYVSSAAIDDMGDGLTPATAKLTIMAAVNLATNPSTVLVNAITHMVDSTPGIDTHIILKEGVSLYGAYNLDFTARDTELNISSVTNTSSGRSPNTAIYISTGITSATVVDGFTFNGSTTGGSSNTRGMTIILNAAPKIKNNIISGGAGTSFSTGILVSGVSAPYIFGNKIHGGSSGAFSYGISNSNSASIIENNLIHGGNGNSSSYGIASSSGSTSTIRNNTINGGNGSSSIGLREINAVSIIQNNTIYGGGDTRDTIGIFTNSASIIQNNIIHSGFGSMYASGIRITEPGAPDIYNNVLSTRTGAGSVCIIEAVVTSDPAVLRNNNMYACSVLYSDFDSNCGGGTDCDIIQINALADITGGASGNISADPMFTDIDGADNDINTMADNDWHFSVGSPASVTAGGLNGIDEMPAWTFTDDKDGVTRPATGTPWAIGAYEP